MGLAKALDESPFRTRDAKMSGLVSHRPDGELMVSISQKRLGRGKKKDGHGIELDGRAGRFTVQGAFAPDRVGHAEELQRRMVRKNARGLGSRTYEVSIRLESFRVQAWRDYRVKTSGDGLHTAPTLMVLELVGCARGIRWAPPGGSELLEHEDGVLGKENVEI